VYFYANQIKNRFKYADNNNKKSLNHKLWNWDFLGSIIILFKEKLSFKIQNYLEFLEKESHRGYLTYQ
jgi:hypothetical protein